MGGHVKVDANKLNDPVLIFRISPVEFKRHFHFCALDITIFFLGTVHVGGPSIFGHLVLVVGSSNLEPSCFELDPCILSSFKMSFQNNNS